MRQWIFRWRGYVLIPPAVVIVLYCQPTVRSFAVGLLIALAGEALRVWGVGYSGVTTRSSKVVAPRLVTAGPYAYVRNPLYLGNFVTALGFAVVAAGDVPWPGRILLFAVVGISYTAVYGAIIPLEEEYLHKTFGPDYDAYVAAVPRVVPRLTPYPERHGEYDWRTIARAESHTLALFLLICLVMLGKLFMQDVAPRLVEAAVRGRL